MIIDATDTIIGRLASHVAKKALLGEKVDIINSEKAIITGDRKQILKRYEHRITGRGTPRKGPFFPRKPHMILKRTIRGMLPYDKTKGREAFRRIKCHHGIPETLQGKEATHIKEASKAKLETKKYITLGKLSEYLGAK